MAENGKTLRRKAEKESSLPYSFKYKIVQEFYGKKCPVCGITMKHYRDDVCVFATTDHIPTIQHNVPISKGGKHELGNISVICKQCNITIQDKITGELNAKEVIKVWRNVVCLQKQ